ncbi:MAG TPA: hypothetical protein VN381_05605 [Anaerovoracaceae bacterium]|nr:hypothetical protein [Anaerovoracaceae bacterium]
MRVYVSIKQAGKKKGILSDLPFEVSDAVITLADFITLIVNENVKGYNAKKPDADFVRLLTQENIDEQAGTGKVAFGRRFGIKDAHPEKAVAAALSAFSDGLYRVFLDEQEILALDENLPLREGGKFAFIRLVFLSGRMW